MAYIKDYHIPFMTNIDQANSTSTNGLSGFKTWECYMIVKYGKPNQWRSRGRI